MVHTAAKLETIQVKLQVILIQYHASGTRLKCLNNIHLITVYSTQSTATPSYFLVKMNHKNPQT